MPKPGASQEELSKWITRAAKELYSRGYKSAEPTFNWYRVIEEALSLGVRHGRKLDA